MVVIMLISVVHMNSIWIVSWLRNSLLANTSALVLNSAGSLIDLLMDLSLYTDLLMLLAILSPRSAIFPSWSEIYHSETNNFLKPE